MPGLIDDEGTTGLTYGIGLHWLDGGIAGPEGLIILRPQGPNTEMLLEGGDQMITEGGDPMITG